MKWFKNINANSFSNPSIFFFFHIIVSFYAFTIILTIFKAQGKQAMADYGSSDSGASLGDILGAALAKRETDDDN